jgi:Flp pilus assembly protein TadG
MAITTRTLKDFNQDERGVVAIIFASCLMMFMLALACAIDYGRAVHSSNKLASSIDAAALAAAKSMRDKNGLNVATVARTHFDQNMKGQASTYHQITQFEVISSKSEVKITASADVKTLFARAAGIEKIKVTRKTTAVYNPVDIEIAMQLDITGSMKGQKLADLKVAAKDLVEIMLPDGGTTNKVRVALAPFAAGVDAGSFAKAVTNGRATSNTCVYERRTPGAEATDAPPTGNSDSLKLQSDLPGANSCPKGSMVLPLTSDKAKIKTKVDAFAADGYTAGHLGTAWAWYTLSPNWAGVWGADTGAAYDPKITKKYAILMTDGEYNTYGGASGNTSKSQQQAKALCDAMKSKGVIVYTVGFQLDDTGARALLSKCATSSSHSYQAYDGAQLRSIFRGIAEEISALRLSQ